MNSEISLFHEKQTKQTKQEAMNKDARFSIVRPAVQATVKEIEKLFLIVLS